LEAFRSGEIAVLEQAGTLAAIVLLRFSTKVLPEVGRIENLSKCSIIVVGRWTALLDRLVAMGVRCRGCRCSTIMGGRGC
jgi:hypothetical protein